jgi:spore maturation protein CgeB
VRATVVGPIADWATMDVAQGWVSGLCDVGVETSFFNLGDRFIYYRSAIVHDETTGALVKQMSHAEAGEATTLGLMASIYRFQPDVVFIVHGSHVAPHLVRELRCKVVLIMTESPYEDDAQARYAAACEPDMILLNDPANGAVFDAIAPSFYLPHAYNPLIHHRGSSDHKSDVCFIGTGFGNRLELFEQTDWDGIDLALGGIWAMGEKSPLAPFVVNGGECVDNHVTADWYRGTKIGVNTYRGVAIGDEASTIHGVAIGPRECEMAACGTFFLRESRPESDELFPFLPSFDGPEELGALVREWLPQDDERRRLGLLAQQAVADRTFANHAVRALKRLGF